MKKKIETEEDEIYKTKSLIRLNKLLYNIKSEIQLVTEILQITLLIKFY